MSVINLLEDELAYLYYTMATSSNAFLKVIKNSYTVNSLVFLEVTKNKQDGGLGYFEYDGKNYIAFMEYTMTDIHGNFLCRDYLVPDNVVDTASEHTDPALKYPLEIHNSHGAIYFNKMC